MPGLGSTTVSSRLLKSHTSAVARSSNVVGAQIVESIGGMAPLDVSAFPRLAILVRNDGDVPITIDRLILTASAQVAPATHLRYLKNVSISIPAGSTLLLSSQDHPILAEPKVGFAVRVDTSGITSGQWHVAFLGGE